MTQKSIGMSCVAVAALIFSSLVGVRSAGAEGFDLDDGYVGPDNPELDHIGVEFRQQDADNEVHSWVGTVQEFAACSDVNGDCGQVEGAIEFTAVLPPCQSVDDNYCIAGIASIDAAGKESMGSFDSYFPDRGYNDFIGDESIGIPSGGPASLWVFPGISHVGGDKFFVRVGISGNKIQSRYVTQTFQAGITPVSPIRQELCTEDIKTRLSIENGGVCSPRITYFDEPLDDGRLTGRFLIGGGSGTLSTEGSDCVMRGNYQGAGVCMTRRAFPSEMRFRLVVRLGEYPKGWLHGRISNPDISFTDLVAPMKGVQISVTGSTLSLPVVAASFKFSQLPPSLYSDYKNANKWEGFQGRGGCCAMSRAYGENWKNDLTQFNYLSYPSAWSDHGIDELNAWLPFVGDKATANLSTWSVRTLSAKEMAGANTCLKDEKKIAGFVSTNATQYSPGPPRFSKSTGTLDYRVAAPHYRSGGDTFLGMYNLIMRSDLARCLYGFSKAPLNASISVVDDQGVTTVGTKNVSEKDGWIKIAAYGFGFSSPTIKIKFASGKLKSIVCVNGKKVRTITGSKPACPKGFKVKK